MLGGSIVLPETFQFPSTGKAHPNLLLALAMSPICRNCFNSLQSGRYIQTRYSRVQSGTGSRVSIPFKREGAAKLIRVNYANGKSVGMMIKAFQFPSTGKVHPNTFTGIAERHAFEVFQFPSIGKVHPNYLLT